MFATVVFAGWSLAFIPADAPPFPDPNPNVYYGAVADAKSPAEVAASKVFEEIPEYKKIKEKGLTQEDPEYYILLNKANAKFFAAVKKAAEAAKHDVVVEKGSAKFEKTPADLTQKTIDALDK